MGRGQARQQEGCVLRPVNNVIRPTSLNEALQAIAEIGPAALPIAGGTDVMVQLMHHKGPLVTLVDLSRIDTLHKISFEKGMLRLGALATHAEVSASTEIKHRFEALAEACAQVGSVQIRNRGTVVGNVANASPCADALTALIALEAVAEIASLGGMREVPVAELLEGPYKTRLRHGEVIVAIKIPDPQARSCFVKLGRRKALAISRINAAAVIRIEGGEVTFARLAVGSVMPKTERVHEAEVAMTGRLPCSEIAHVAGEIVAKKMIEVTGIRWSTPYKEVAVKSVVARAVAGAMGISL